jgi:aspartyl protease family protein
MNFNSLQNGDWQNLIYILLAVILMLSGLLGGGIAFKKLVKFLIIWSAIGFVIIGVYTYRYELTNIKNRITEEINPTKARLYKDNQIVINVSQDGHFYIDALVNKIPIRFMIDTGASDMVISSHEAKKIGINLAKLNFNKQYQTANGISWGASISLDEIEFANVKFYDVYASVNNADMGIALLGMSFLRKFDKYEFFHDRLILTFKSNL